MPMFPSLLPCHLGHRSAHLDELLGVLALRLSSGYPLAGSGIIPIITTGISSLPGNKNSLSDWPGTFGPCPGFIIHSDVCTECARCKFVARDAMVAAGSVWRTHSPLEDPVAKGHVRRLSASERRPRWCLNFRKKGKASSMKNFRRLSLVLAELNQFEGLAWVETTVVAPP